MYIYIYIYIFTYIHTYTCYAKYLECNLLIEKKNLCTSCCHNFFHHVTVLL